MGPARVPTPGRLEDAERFFRRHGGKVVTIARFAEGLRQATGIIVGISKTSWRRFMAFNLLGAALWAGAWTTVGDVAGQHIGAIYQQFTHYEKLGIPVGELRRHGAREQTRTDHLRKVTAYLGWRQVDGLR